MVNGEWKDKPFATGRSLPRGREPPPEGGSYRDQGSRSETAPTMARGGACTNVRCRRPLLRPMGCFSSFRRRRRLPQQACPGFPLSSARLRDSSLRFFATNEWRRDRAVRLRDTMIRLRDTMLRLRDRTIRLRDRLLRLCDTPFCAPDGIPGVRDPRDAGAKALPKVGEALREPSLSCGKMTIYAVGAPPSRREVTLRPSEPSFPRDNSGAGLPKSRLAHYLTFVRPEEAQGGQEASKREIASAAALRERLSQ